MIPSILRFTVSSLVLIKRETKMYDQLGTLITVESYNIDLIYSVLREYKYQIPRIKPRYWKQRFTLGENKSSAK